MIRLTRLNGSELYLNADLVLSVESRPDTVVTLVDGKHFVVADSAETVITAITRYRAMLLALADRTAEELVAGEESAAGRMDVAPQAAAAREPGIREHGHLVVLQGNRD